MAGTAWPALIKDGMADALAVEQKFEWFQGNLVPMSSGVRADNSYDIGSASHRWRDAHVSRQVTTANEGTLGTPTVSLVGASSGLNYPANALEIIANAQKAQRMTSLGVTEPNAQRFLLARNSEIFTTDAVSSILFNRELFSNNADLGVTNGGSYFKAKTDGYYFAHFSMLVLMETPLNDLVARLSLGDGNICYSRVEPPASAMMSAEIITYMTAGSYITITQNHTSGRSARFFHGNTWGYFGGYFLG